MSEKTINRVVVSAGCYVILISILIAAGLNHDEALDKATSTLSLETDGTHFFKYFALLLLVYFVRAALLLVPFLLKDKKWERITTWGIGFCIFPELIVIYSALGLVLADGSNCPGPGPYSNCGWGFLIVLPIVASIILQIVGMIVGLIVALFKK